MTTTPTEVDLRKLVQTLFLNGDTTFPLAADADLVAEGVCDSLGLVQLAAALEGQFPGLRVLDQDITRENLGSIAAMLAFLRERAP